MFTINKSHETTLKQVLKAAKSSGYIQAYDNAYISASKGSVTIIAGDGAIELSAELKDCDIKSDGAACVDASKLSQAIAACKFDCSVIFKDGFIEVKNSKSKFKLVSVNPETYPAYPDTGSQKKLNVNANQLLASVKSAIVIAPEQDARHYLNGVKIGNSICATDGHRLVLIDSEETPNAIIPAKSVKAIPDLDGEIYLSDNFLTLKSDVITFKTKLIDGKYPEVERVIQKPVRFAKVDTDSLRDAVRSATITANKTTNGVRMVIDSDGGKITATGNNQEQSVIGFDADSSESIEIAFNAKYILDAMSYYTGTVEFGFTDGQLIIKTDGMTNVIMGMKL